MHSCVTHIDPGMRGEDKLIAEAHDLKHTPSLDNNFGSAADNCKFDCPNSVLKQWYEGHIGVL